MIKLRQQPIFALSTSERTACGQMLTRSRLRRYLQPDRIPEGLEKNIQVYSAHIPNGNSVGILIFRYIPELYTAQILDLAVLPAYRRQGIARRMLRQLAENLQQQACSSISIDFEQESASAPALLHLLAQEGWGRPRQALLRCHFYAPTFTAPWLHAQYRLPADCEPFMWQDLTDAEWQRLNYLEKELSFPSYVSPLRTQYAFEPLNSIGLRRGEEVAGWMVNSRIDKSTIRYSAFFVRPELRVAGCAFYLLQQAILLQQKSSVPEAICEVNYQQGPLTWPRFVDKHLIPYTSHTTHQLTARLPLR
jgi:GNAT superfamily N-acetyltransferase